MADPEILTRFEEKALHDWRHMMFVALGYDDMDAAVLANEGVDWHQLAKLIDAGCPLDTAARILL